MIRSDSAKRPALVWHIYLLPGEFVFQFISSICFISQQANLDEVDCHTQGGLMIITITMIGGLCLPPRTATGVRAYEFMFNIHTQKTNKPAPCDNLGLNQQAANLFPVE